MSDDKLEKAKLKMEEAKHQAQQVWVNLVAFLKKFFIVLLISAGFILGFLYGARMHELGYLKGFFGKSLKGSALKVSGRCLVDGEPRDPALAEDLVKITADESDKIFGVILQTREEVECSKDRISIDLLPLLKDFFKPAAQIPEIKMAEHRKKSSPLKLLENKILLISGTCKNQLDGKELPPFTDEKMDVTSVELSKDSESANILGIRRSDKLALLCSSHSIRYSIWDGTDPITVEKPKEKLTFIGKNIYVTGNCPPDPRLPVAPKLKDGRKMIFIGLQNVPVQVLEETFEDDHLVRFMGSVSDPKSEAFNVKIACDSKKFPFSYKAETSEEIKLDRPDSEAIKKGIQDSANVITEENKDVKDNNLKNGGKNGQ